MYTSHLSYITCTDVQFPFDLNFIQDSPCLPNPCINGATCAVGVGPNNQPSFTCNCGPTVPGALLIVGGIRCEVSTATQIIKTKYSSR